ncbi:MAG: ECF transporter S component [Lactobacillales bacterium]|jgi:uncharacterized membrane protein|nr:ECF transporter S component [Lactobacillales bacterium]
MRNTSTKNLTITAIFITILIVLDWLQTMIFTVWPFPIKPTVLHVPVIIASIVLGPKIGAFLGGVMGIISFVTATVTAGPTNFLFSPLQPVPGTNHGDLRALIIAIVPRILIGIIPYYVYKLFKKHENLRPVGLILSGVVGSFTNTIFVLGGIFLIFRDVLGWTFQVLLTSIVATNSIAEAIVSGVLVLAITPTLLKITNK